MKVKSYLVFGESKQITRMIMLLIALEEPFRYDGKNLHFDHDMTDLMNDECPELDLACIEE